MTTIIHTKYGNRSSYVPDQKILLTSKDIADKNVIEEIPKLFTGYTKMKVGSNDRNKNFYF